MELDKSEGQPETNKMKEIRHLEAKLKEHLNRVVIEGDPTSGSKAEGASKQSSDPNQQNEFIQAKSLTRRSILNGCSII